ncbi:MAG: AmmeMemoRadiSam system protein B, partial [Lachnospiraceae bacterium]|nr:AmmeMemoRadiSam system protein B [Lachnospiraceae bacterium]
MSIKAFYMVPHPPIAVHEIGRGEEEMIRPSLDSYDAVARDIAKIKPETIIITSPHQVLYSDYFHISPGRHATGDFSSFRAPEVTFNVDYDEELVNKISELCGLMNFPAGPDGERNPSLDHGVMVPLYFINKYYTNYKLVRIGLSGLSLEAHYHFGELIANAVQALGRSCVFVGSGDLSHCQKQDGPYGYKPEGPAYDEKLMDTMNRGAFKELLNFDEVLLDKAEECGHRSFTIMGGAVGNDEVDITTLSHESTFGVGYGFAIYHPKEKQMNKTESNDIYVNLAKMTIAEYITDHKRLKVPDDLPDELTKTRAGAFVSIHEHGMLRGCIGTIGPVRDSLAEEI